MVWVLSSLGKREELGVSRPLTVYEQVYLTLTGTHLNNGVMVTNRLQNWKE